MKRAYFYVVARDFGFAPNPFHGVCTLATCKPGIRARAQREDWVIGLGGARLKATGRCIYAMKVTDHLTFDEYWSSREFLDKRPVRNGSARMMVGDNIYHRQGSQGDWQQADSHHSHLDGTPNASNITRDTSANRVLVSNHFFYFGKAAPEVPGQALIDMAYRNCRSYRIYDQSQCKAFFDWLYGRFESHLNRLLGDPFDFSGSGLRYSATDNRLR